MDSTPMHGGKHILPCFMPYMAIPFFKPVIASDVKAWTWTGIEKRLYRDMDEQKEFCHSKWRLSLHDGAFMDRTGWSPGEGALAIGYAIRAVFQRQGFAEEAAEASIHFALVHHIARHAKGGRSSLDLTRDREPMPLLTIATSSSARTADRLDAGPQSNIAYKLTAGVGWR